MLPKSVVWQQLRQRALDAIPVGTVVSYAAPIQLDAWLDRGAFTVTASSKNSFDVVAPSVDVGAMLYAESSYMLDHAVEHAIGMRHQLAAARWQSSAWTVIAIYYWAFFSALSLTRLQGHTPLFISRQAAAKLRTLSPNPTKAPGAGPFVFEVGPSVSMSQRAVFLRRASQTRVHDTVWVNWFAWVRSILKQHTAGRGDLEVRIFQALVRSANALGDSWPSDVRNVLNYVPGAGYGTVRGHTPADVLGQIRIDPASELPQIVDRIEANVAALDSTRSISDQLRLTCKVLVDACILLDVISWELLVDVSSRRSIDRRWMTARSRFAATNAQAFNHRSWPCGDVAK